MALPVFADSVASRRTRPEFQNLEKISPRALTDLNSRWQGYRAQVKKWEDQLLEKAGQLSEGLEQLNRLAALWSAARDSARASTAPVVLRRQIDRTLSSIDQRREELEQRFLAEAAEHGLRELKGHRSVGGIRASIYNAMPVEGVEALRQFMVAFRERHAD